MVANPQIRERKQEGTPSNPDTFLGVDAYTVPQGIDAAGMENAVIDAQKKINQKRDTFNSENAGRATRKVGKNRRIGSKEIEWRKIG